MQLDGAALDSPAGPLNDVLRIGLDRAPDEVAIVSADRELSWRELDRASTALAGGYRRMGLESGDRIPSLMLNRSDLMVHYLACFRAGAVATPLNYRYTAREIDHALDMSDARVLLAHVERAEEVAASELARGLKLGTIASSRSTAPVAASRSRYVSSKTSCCRVCPSREAWRAHPRSMPPRS
jgi:long-chain acyl-CoA synthetase